MDGKYTKFKTLYANANCNQLSLSCTNTVAPYLCKDMNQKHLETLRSVRTPLEHQEPERDNTFRLHPAIYIYYQQHLFISNLKNHKLICSESK